MEIEKHKTFVVLFQSDLSENDNKYVRILNNSGLNAKNIPTLSFNFVNHEKLKRCLENERDYSGIIFTSTKAVKAVASVSIPYVQQWKEKLNFSVGQATSGLVMSLLNFETYGSDAGNSEKLCDIILQKCEHCEKPFIFPCSNIRKNSIPDVLSQHGIQIEEIVCYETVPNIQFKELWENVLKEDGFPEIVVFFSPSGVQFCCKTVMDYYANRPKPKCVSIGPSTEKALLETNISSKVSEKPNPESVLCAIKYLLNM